MGSGSIRKHYLKEALQWLEAVVLAVLIALLIRAYVFEPVRVYGSSMQNTLYSEERLVVFKLGYRFHPPERGDIVVLRTGLERRTNNSIIDKIPLISSIFPYNGEIDYIKRVVGLPGEKIEVKNGFVYINGSRLEEPYIKGKTYEKSVDLPDTVPEGCVFVMGDNRENSRDSREIGFIEYDRIKGCAVFRIWPPKRIGLVK